MTQHEHYKEFVVWKVGRVALQAPCHMLIGQGEVRQDSLTHIQVAKGNLHILDFQRIKDSLRASSRKLLLDPETNLPNSLAQELSIPSTSTIPGATFSQSAKAGGAIGGTAVKGGKGRLMTPEEKKRVVEALTRAQTTEEVRRLERMLADGLVPEGGMEEGVNGTS